MESAIPRSAPTARSTAPCWLRSSIAWRAVSYTHLDVYKRQKLDYAKAQFSLTDSDVFFCSECPVLDLTKRCIYGFEQYLRACAQSSILPQTEYPAETVLICEDIFCGIVPMEDLERKWRDLAGRTLTVLASKANTVTRIFCGLPQQLKP